MGSGTEILSGLALVALGSALGGLARYAVSVRLEGTAWQAWPIDTLLVNLSGAFLIGLLLAAGVAEPDRSAGAWKLFLVVGFLGSYTTVSALSLQILVFLTDERRFTALAYLVVSVAAGLVLTVLGYGLGRMVAG